MWLNLDDILEYNRENKRGDDFMATASFDKQFTVKKEKAEDFVKSF